MEWLHETFGKRNVVERWFFYIKHRMLSMKPSIDG